MHEVLVNRLGGLSLPRKSVVRLTDRPDMTLDVYRGRKTAMHFGLRQILVISGNFLHCRVWTLCNQLLLQFSMDHFETMHTCCGYIEDVHVNFCRRKNNF